MFSMVLVGFGSVSFDTDPDSGSTHFFMRIRIQGNDTDSTDPDLPHCRSGSGQKLYGSGSSKKVLSARKKARNPCFAGVYYFTITCL